MKQKLLFPIIVALLGIALLAPLFIEVTNAAYIFSDGFESGNLNAYTVTYGTLSINNQTVNSGAYSVQNNVVGNNENLYYQALVGSLPNPIYLREYVYINSTTTPSTSGDYYEVGGFSTSTGGNYGDGEICIFNVAGTLYWGVYYRDVSSVPTGFSHIISNSNNTSTAHPVSIGWNCIELQHTNGTFGVNGNEQLYLNGVSIINASANNYDRTPANVVIGGSQHVANSNDKWNYYIDDVIVSNSYIGPIIYQITMSTNFGTVSPASGQYAEGTTIPITATAPIAASGERYVWQGWVGSGVGSYTGTNNPATVTMGSAITEQAVWEHDYYLTVTSANGVVGGAGWYNNGTSAYASVSPTTVAGTTGTQYVFTGWSGDASGTTSPSNVITMNAPKNAVANWKTQYYLNVTSVNGTVGGSGWYDSGTNASATLNSLTVAGATGTQYVFTTWSGNASGTTSPSNPITMNAPKTAIANWKTQYYLNVTSTYGSPSPTSAWFDNGSNIIGSVATPVSNASGTQYVCTGWSGSGSVPASGSASTVTFTINAPSNIAWTWQTQYYLNVSSTYGAAGGAGWYNNGTSAYASVSPTTVAGATGTQYVFTGWSGDASGTFSPSNAITMNAPKIATANWQTQYYLNVSSTYGAAGGAGWYNNGTSANATIPLMVAGTTGTQYVFTTWSGDASGATSPSNPIIMNAPKMAVANWKTQYSLTFAQSGVGSDFSGTIIIVNGTGYDRFGFATWANSSDVYTFSYAPQLVVAANSKQCLLTGVSGNGSALSFSVSQSITVTGAYKTQFYLTATSAYDSPSPANGWYDSGSSISAFVASPVSAGSGTQYVCTGWSGSGSATASGSASAMSFTISAPSTIAWTWKTQYLVSFVVSPSGDGSTSPSGTNTWQDAGSISISGTPSYNFKFSLWSADSGSITVGNIYAGSTTATINGPGTLTANFAALPAATPTPTPVHTPTPTNTPTPHPTASPTAKPTNSSPTPTSSQSTQNLATNPYIYGTVIAIIIVAIIAAIIATQKRKKTSTSK